MTREIRTLTGLRGVAAIVVLLYHFCENDWYYQPYMPWLITHGYIGVDMFFVLSGFVMALSYAGYFSHGISLADHGAFMINRLARIYPLYILITLAFVIKAFVNMSGTGPGRVFPADLAASLLMVQSWGFGFASIAGATWSLSTEFFAYIAFPVLVTLAVFGRPAHAAAVAAASVVAMYMVAASHLGIAGQLDVVSPDSVLPLLRCVAGFCLGLVAYRVWRSRRANRFFGAPFTLAGLLAALLLAGHLHARDLLLFCFFPPIVVALAMESGVARLLFANRVVHHLGVVSYSLYLVHPLLVPVKVRLEPIAHRFCGDAAHSLTLAFGLLLTWGAACALYWGVEKPGRAYAQAALQRRAVRQPV